MADHYLQTGQRRCYDAGGREIACAGSGQDAERRRGVAWPVPRFEATREIVVDRLTGLSWCRDAALSEFPLTWTEAFAFVSDLNRERRSGHADWRVPNRRELRSLVDHQARRPVLPEGHPFRNVFPGWYWSSTTAAISPSHAWYVNLDGGRMFYGGKDQSFMVWPVRGRGNDLLPATGQRSCYDAAGRELACPGSGQDGEHRLGRAWPSPRFVPEGGAVRDALTGLLWRRAAEPCGPVHWDDALRAATETGWRLPNINELESLVDCAHFGPALPRPQPFTDVRDVYWSSTSSAFEPDWAWALYLDKGAIGVGRKREARFCVWLVADEFPADGSP